MAGQWQRLDPTIGKRLLQRVQNGVMANRVLKFGARHANEVAGRFVQQLPLFVVGSLILREDLGTLLPLQELGGSTGPESQRQDDGRKRHKGKLASEYSYRLRSV